MKNSNTVTFNFTSIVSQFKIKGNIAEVEPYGSGHIHDTFRIVNKHAEFPDYILQRINHHIFRDISALSENIRKVTMHLRKKLEATANADPDKEVLTLIPTQQSKDFYQDEEGNFWRMYYFLKDTHSYDVVKTQQQAYQGGKAFGKFLALLSDLDANSLFETIPNFHHVEDRLRLFEEAIQRDPKNRVREVFKEIKFVNRRAGTMSILCRLERQGKLPLRITHSDTKFNNILLNKQDHAQCVIDLDTVMPGLVAYDFGDAIRTIINTAAEDEKDLEKIALNIDLFEESTKGFLEETGSLLSEMEVKSLVHGVLILPYLMGLRFLTDYVDGDHYYKIQFPDHNIQRARAQFKLVERLEEQHFLLESIIKKYSNSRNQVSV